MHTSINKNPPLYTMTAGIEKNSVLNRALMEAIGIEVPFAIMSNNKDEFFERALRGLLFIFASFIAPVITMPLINKFILKNMGIIRNTDEVHILRVSKKYLAKNAKLMLEGF